MPRDGLPFDGCVALVARAGRGPRRHEGLSDGSPSEPEPNHGHSYGAVKDVGLFVKAGCRGPEALELIDCPLDLVPAGVERWVKGGGATALAAAVLAVGPPVASLGNGVFDLSAPQVTAVRRELYALSPLR